MKTLNKLYSIAKEFVKEYESNIKEIEVNEPKQVGKLIKTKEVFSKDVLNCFDNCLKFFPEHLYNENKESWIETIDKLNRLDKIPFSEIERITEAARKDEFISKNIFLSLPKLRTKNRDKIYWIVVWFERFKPKEQKINRQTQEVIEKNSKGW
jgi:hypothetical protein